MKNISLLALAAVAVNASPLQKRQVSSAASAASSGLASVISSGVLPTGAASSAIASATDGVSSATAGVPSVTAPVSSALSSVSEAASSAVATATGGVNATNATGTETYPAYPCPPGFLLTYVEQNVTLPATYSEVRAIFGNWSSSPIFPNITDIMGAGIGSSRTINIGGAALAEELVNYTTTGASSAQYTWNLTNGPVTAMGVSISNYSTVLSLYDPSVESTNTTGTNTTALTFTNFCASSQPAGMELVGALASLELGTLSQLVAAGSAPNMTEPVSSMASMAAPSSMASSAVASVTSAASMAASSGVASASMAASSAVQSVSSVSSAISSAIASAISSTSA